MATDNMWARRTRSPEPERRSDLLCEISGCLVLVVSVIESLRPDRGNVTLSVVLDIAKLALTAHWIYLTTHWLRTQYSSHPVIHFLLATMPWATDSSTTFAVVRRLLTRDDVAAMETFLLGSAHAKPLVLGALPLIVQGVWPSVYPGAPRDVSPSSVQVLWYSGLLVVATTMGVEGKWLLLI
jgi:hypothetical protein